MKLWKLTLNCAGHNIYQATMQMWPLKNAVCKLHLLTAQASSLNCVLKCLFKLDYSTQSQQSHSNTINQNNQFKVSWWKMIHRWQASIQTAKCSFFSILLNTSRYFPEWKYELSTNCNEQYNFFIPVKWILQLAYKLVFSHHSTYKINHS